MDEKEIKRALAPGRLPDERRTWRCPDEMRLAAYVEKRLTGHDQARVERHLAGCGYCLGQVAALIQLQEAELPADVPAGIIARARDLGAGTAAPLNRAWRWSAIAATACIALVATFLVRQPQFRVVPPTDAVRKAPDRAAAPELLFPREGAGVPHGAVEFRWSPIERGLYYEVRVLSADGDLVWEGRAEGLHVRLPEKTHLIAGQKYYVSVSATLADGRFLKSPLVGFQVTGQ